MIPAAAVEAAARALFEKELGRPMEVSDEPLYSEDIQACREDARAALEAAAPYMQVSTQRPERGWIAKNRNADGSVSIIGHFRNEAEAEKYAEMWPAAIVERAL